MFNRRSFLVLVATSTLAACAAAREIDIPDGTRLIILRHADRDGEDLNDLGRARALALITALKGIPIDAIYTPAIQRNVDTATPLAADRDLPVHQIPDERAASRLMRAGKGKTVVWVGNKNNLAAIWAALSLPDPPFR